MTSVRFVSTSFVPEAFRRFMDDEETDLLRRKRDEYVAVKAEHAVALAEERRLSAEAFRLRKEIRELAIARREDRARLLSKRTNQLNYRKRLSRIDELSEEVANLTGRVEAETWGVYVPHADRPVRESVPDSLSGVDRSKASRANRDRHKIATTRWLIEEKRRLLGRLGVLDRPVVTGDDDETENHDPYFDF